MKVLLRRNVAKLGKIGEVVEVKPGYARNYLLPERVAVEPTQANLRAIEAEKQQYLEELARVKANLQTRADLINGREITLSVRANEEGHLYGSVGPAQVAAGLCEQGAVIEPENIVLDAAIRKVGEYEIEVRFDEEIKAAIQLTVLAPGVELAEKEETSSDDPPARDVLEEEDSEEPEA